MGKVKTVILSRDDIEQIHKASIKVLKTIGAQFLNDEALNYLEKYDCTTDRKRMIATFPEEVIKEFMKKAKSEQPHVNRSFKPIPKREVYFKTFGQGTYITDRNGAVRPSTYKDQERVLIVGNALPAVDAPTSAVAARDIPPWKTNFVGTVRNWNLLSNPNKEISYWPAADTDELMEVVMTLCSILAGSREKLLKIPIIMGGGCPTSPLVWPNIICANMIQCAKNGMNTTGASMGVSGSTTPMSLAGTLVIHNAEMLSRTVFSQMVAYDAGFQGVAAQMSCSTTTMDVRKGYCPVGNPEMALINACAIELGQYYNSPSRCAGA